jgi:hypothetical protein
MQSARYEVREVLLQVFDVGSRQEAIANHPDRVILIESG